MREALQRVPATALVVAAAFSFQGGAALATTLFDDVGPLGAVWLRQLFGALVLLALNAGVLRRLRSRPLAPVLALGLSLAVMNSFFYASIDRIPLGLAVTIEFLGPLGVAVAGSRRLRDFVWIALAAAGVALLGSPTLDLDPVGIAFALGAAACWASYILLAKRLGERWPLLDGLTLAIAVTALLLTPLGVASGGGELLDASTLGVGLAIGVLASVVPYGLELAALRRLATHTFGILMSLEPAVAAVVGAVFLSQALSPLEALAVAFVVAASIGANVRARTPMPPSP
ncbi:MAG TPA: EamA family transporter [Gaiellaceae bacterium]|nr:EamA family transporter [Gaiellaceae bacterium]